MRFAVFTLLLCTGLHAAPLPPGVEGQSLGSFRVIYYWISLEDDEKGEADTELFAFVPKRTKSPPTSLGKFRAAFVKSLKVEGTGRTLDGRTLNVASRGTFQVINQPWGNGSTGKPLTPFRSIAVDPRTIPVGTQVFIAEAVGALLPDGTVHDGVFTAEDTGGGLNGARMDLFVGLERDRTIMDGARISANAIVYRLTRDSRAPPAPLAFPHKATVRFDNARVLSGADVKAAPTKSLAKGAVVDVLAQEHGWWKLGDGEWLEGPMLDLREASPALTPSER